MVLLQLLRGFGGRMDRCIMPGAPIPRVIHDELVVLYGTAGTMKRCEPAVTLGRQLLAGDADNTSAVLNAMRTCFGARPATDKLNPALVKRLRKLQTAMPTTLEQDEQLALTFPALEAGQDPPPAQIAVAYRMARKKALAALIETLEFSVQEAKDARAKARAAELDSAAASAAIVHGDAHVQPVVSPEDASTAFVPRAQALARGADPSDLHAQVERFNAWFAAAQPPEQSIAAALVGHGMRVGTIALRDVEPGQVYLAVPNEVRASMPLAWLRTLPTHRSSPPRRAAPRAPPLMSLHRLSCPEILLEQTMCLAQSFQS